MPRDVVRNSLLAFALVLAAGCAGTGGPSAATSGGSSPGSQAAMTNKGVANLNLAQNYLAAGKLEYALDRANRALRSDPNSADVQVVLGLIRERLGDSARAALSVLERGDHFDLLFTDIMMPGGMNGVELADAARKLRPGLRVLFSSGYSQENLVRGGRVPEGIHLLAKPYQKQALAERVRQALATPQENSP